MESAIFRCEKHGDVRINIIRMGGCEFGRFCPLCAEANNAEGIKKLGEHDKAVERGEYVKFCRRCHIESEFYDKTLDGYIPQTQTQKEAKEAVEKLIADKSGKILLLGSNGVGKTMLASIAARELGGKIYTMYEISTRVRQSYTAKACETELEIMNELSTEPFLAIDEFGRSKCSDAERNWLSHIVRVRHSNNRPLIIVSNKHFGSLCLDGGCSDCIENYIDKDVLSRFSEGSVCISISAPDYRRGR